MCTGLSNEKASRFSHLRENSLMVRCVSRLRGLALRESRPPFVRSSAWNVRASRHRDIPESLPKLSHLMRSIFPRGKSSDEPNRKRRLLQGLKYPLEFATQGFVLYVQTSFDDEPCVDTPQVLDQQFAHPAKWMTSRLDGFQAGLAQSTRFPGSRACNATEICAISRITKAREATAIVETCLLSCYPALT
jgi:hypothetical protein